VPTAQQFASGKRLIRGEIIIRRRFLGKVSKMLAWAAFGLAMAGFVSMLPDIKRYIRISAM
jgi:hypothetical protein